MCLSSSSIVHLCYTSRIGVDILWKKIKNMERSSKAQKEAMSQLRPPVLLPVQRFTQSRLQQSELFHISMVVRGRYQLTPYNKNTCKVKHAVTGLLCCYGSGQLGFTHGHLLLRLRWGQSRNTAAQVGPPEVETCISLFPCTWFVEYLLFRVSGLSFYCPAGIYR